MQTHSEMSEHPSRLEVKQRETSQLRDEARQKELKISELERELQRLRLESAGASPRASVAAAEPPPPVAAAATVPVQPAASDSLLDARPADEQGSRPAEAAAAAAAAAAADSAGASPA